MEKTIINSGSIEDTKEFAHKISSQLKSGDVVALYGDLGSGKTTFTTYLVHSLGIDSRVQSPTFVIIRRYAPDTALLEDSKVKIVNHIDLYRLTTKEEVEDLGLQEIMTEQDAVTIIEWPEIAEDLLPEGTIKICFEYVDENERKISANV